MDLEIQKSQYIRPKVTVHKCAEIIQGRKLYEEIRYTAKFEIKYGWFFLTKLYLVKCEIDLLVHILNFMFTNKVFFSKSRASLIAPSKPRSWCSNGTFVKRFFSDYQDQRDGTLLDWTQSFLSAGRSTTSKSGRNNSMPQFFMLHINSMVCPVSKGGWKLKYF